MKSVLLATMLLVSGFAMGEVCTSVNQNPDRGEVNTRRDPAKRTRGQRSAVKGI